EAVLRAVADLVELLLHAGGELVVDEVVEVAVEELHDREGREGRDQRGALLEAVVAREDRLDDRRVRARAADPAGLELPDETGLRQPRGRLRLVARRRE